MSDQRDPEPEVRIIDTTTRKGDVYEIEMAAWPYSGIKSEKVFSRKVIYRLNAEDFDMARNMANIGLKTLQAMHDIWKAKIVRIQEGTTEV